MSGGTTYEFVSWSDGGAANHNISTPASNTTYTATYRVATGGTGNGLSVTYYNNIDFTGTTVTGVDPTVDFAWGTGSPSAAIAADTFSARWTGQVEAQFTGTYTFYTVSDDGVRLWVNGQQIINNWTDHAPTENSGTIALTAGQRYDIRMEFYENGGGATARLLWSSASVPKAVVPSTRLYPAAAAPSAIRINFQPSSAPVPAGYLADGGLVYAARGNGQTYGWNADNTAQTRDRNAANSADQRYDTLNASPEARRPRRGLGDCGAERHLRGSRGVWRRQQLRQRVPHHRRGCADRHRHADDLDAMDRRDLDGDRHRRTAHHPQRRRRQQQQDLFCGNNTVVSR